MIFARHLIVSFVLRCLVTLIPFEPHESHSLPFDNVIDMLGNFRYFSFRFSLNFMCFHLPNALLLAYRK